MRDFIFLMHTDANEDVAQDWDGYLSKLKATGRFEGGSGVGAGACYRKSGATPPVTDHIGGYIRVSAKDLHEAAGLLDGNPVYEAGGTVEIRELPKS
ncbi:MAG TPA: YciI family protein [Hyphomonadaceae bacterium]|jgi:hypothetical protein|nr:YciI family protein [Hyphomonadaceae bacterium]